MKAGGAGMDAAGYCAERLFVDARRNFGVMLPAAHEREASGRTHARCPCFIKRCFERDAVILPRLFLLL